MGYFQVNSLTSLCVDYVVKNLANYTSSNDVENLPFEIKKCLLRKFTSSNYFWKNLTFNRGLAMLVDGLTMKVDLTLVLVDNEILDILSKCRNMRKVYMTRYSPNLTTEKIIQCVSSFDKMVYLLISSCDMVNDDVLVSVAKSCPVLNALDVYGCTNVTDKGVVAISELANLFSLTLSSTQVSNYGVERLIQGKSGPKMKELRLANCAHLSSSILHLIATSCPDIEILVFYNVEITESECDNQSCIFDANKFKNLKQLTWTIQF